MRLLDTTNAFTTCKKRIKNVFSPGPVIHHSKVERHRCNIVKPPPCIHTADIRPLQSTTLQGTTLQAPHCRAPLQWCKPHCKSVAQQSGCRLQEGRCSSRLPPRTDKGQPFHSRNRGTYKVLTDRGTSSPYIALSNCTNPGIK